MFTCVNEDIELLRCVYEYRILTVNQLAMALGRNVHALRRRLRLLAPAGLVDMVHQAVSRGRGRPEALVSLGSAAIGLLYTRGVLTGSSARRELTANKIQCVQHELLFSEFRAQLAAMSRVITYVRARFVFPRGCTVPDGEEVGGGTECVEMDGAARTVEFVPDGTFALTHAQSGQSLLFFVEVDQGTQPLVSAQHTRDVREKLTNYQALLETGAYRRHERLLSCSLRGFRLLVLTTCPSRLGALCRLVRECPATDFVWLTEEESLRRDGAWGAIWCVGGQLSEPRQSILGMAMPRSCPTPVHLRAGGHRVHARDDAC
jgi:hypothetical protein